uniref:Uncharacterized protein n=1 Tax=Arundo donax TaxID=35708 RepID=A0A0A9H0M4_ARUDO
MGKMHFWPIALLTGSVWTLYLNRLDCGNQGSYPGDMWLVT